MYHSYRVTRDLGIGSVIGGFIGGVIGPYRVRRVSEEVITASVVVFISELIVRTSKRSVWDREGGVGILV